jgi:hypothetical protein
MVGPSSWFPVTLQNCLATACKAIRGLYQSLHNFAVRRLAAAFTPQSTPKKCLSEKAVAIATQAGTVLPGL